MATRISIALLALLAVAAVAAFLSVEDRTVTSSDGRYRIEFEDAGKHEALVVTATDTGKPVYVNNQDFLDRDMNFAVWHEHRHLAYVHSESVGDFILFHDGVRWEMRELGSRCVARAFRDKIRPKYQDDYTVCLPTEDPSTSR